MDIDPFKIITAVNALLAIGERVYSYIRKRQAARRESQKIASQSISDVRVVRLVEALKTAGVKESFTLPEDFMRRAIKYGLIVDAEPVAAMNINRHVYRYYV